MFYKLLLVALLVFTMVGCSSTDLNNQHEITEEVSNSDREKTTEATDLTTDHEHDTLYDPATIKIDDDVGKMKVAV